MLKCDICYCRDTDINVYNLETLTRSTTTSMKFLCKFRLFESRILNKFINEVLTV